MAAKSNTYANQCLALLLNGTAIPNIADNAATSPLTNLYVSLHTSTPGATGNQSTNEAAYTSYARVAVPRNGTGWVVSGTSASPAATISFPQATAGSETETYFAIGTASTGTGEIIYYGPISPTIPVSLNTQPQLLSSSTLTES